MLIYITFLHQTDNDETDAVSNDNSLLEVVHPEEEVTENNESTDFITTVVDETNIEKNETILKDASNPEIREQSNPDTENNEATILIASVINEIVDSVFIQLLDV